MLAFSESSTAIGRLPFGGLAAPPCGCSALSDLSFARIKSGSSEASETGISSSGPFLTRRGGGESLMMVLVLVRFFFLELGKASSSSSSSFELPRTGSVVLVSLRLVDVAVFLAAFSPGSVS